jgi:GDP-4-dehydro-6-deoxy-D-mannose reductase
VDILVTGSSGFVGRWVARHARAAGRFAGECDWDLTDAELTAERIAADRPSAVIHLAAAARGGDPWAALAGDARMAGALVGALAAHAPDAVLLVPGSAAQYGAGAPRPLAEGDPTEPISPYGAAKCALERALMSPLRRGVRVIWTRSFNHIGPGQGRDAPAGQWARQIAAAERAGGGTLRTGPLHVTRDFLDVRDVADAYLALVCSDAEGVVNVCSGVETELSEVVDLFVRQARVPVSLRRDPALERRDDPPHVVGDPGLLRARTGWSPRVALADSVADQLDEARAGVAADADLARVAR